MRVLLISCRFPTDLKRDVQGTFRRFNLFLDAFEAIGQLDILFYVNDDAGVDYASSAIDAREKALSKHWGTSIKLFLCPQRHLPNSVPKWKRQLGPVFDFREQRIFYPTSASKQIEALEDCLERKPDAIFCHRLEAMTPILQTLQSLPPVFFDLDDIEHISFARQIRQPPTRLATNLYYLQIPALWWGERCSIQKSLQTFVCSNLDQKYLRQRWKLKNVVSIPNAVAIPESQSLCSEPTLMLLGGYYYFPNLNAANFLIDRVWPHVHKARPDAKLIIAGTHPENIHSYNQGVAGVEFIGFVEDLNTLYAQTRVVCCPILSGGGTRVKMIEAAAYGKAIVATQIGAEGLDMVDGRDYLQRNDEIGFADACIQLLKKDELCQSLGAAARRAAIKKYDRSNVVNSIRDHVRSAMN